MSEPILMALLQLFAIVAASAGKQVTENARKILESYLDQHLNAQELEEYLKLFDELLLFHPPEEGMNPDGEILEKTKAICNRVRKQLTSRDRQIVFIKFLEFLDALSREKDGRPATPDRRFLEYLEVFKAAFNPPGQEFDNAIAFVTDPTGPSMHPARLLVVGRADPGIPGQVKVIQRDNLDGHLFILHLPSIRTLIGRYVGNDDLYLNGHPIQPLRSFVISGGAIVKNQKIAPVYHADILAQFLRTTERTPLEFTAREIEFRFRNSSNGIHPFSFTATSGELIGVMGGSGVGKSTLLNALNGNLALTSGQVLINGHDLGKEREKMQGLIGFVPQDDLLIEELTVFQNLYYNARLCFRDHTRRQLVTSVMRVLRDIDLAAIRNLPVGDPINKYISGGQRKRLNIALELIREPSVLFADEPTSGLSSMDSEMVMLLLKEQTLKGRLVIVNIHQPSSDIFKLFDKLLIMDKGGFPIYYGNPIDALTWFKTASNHVNPDESECGACGYVNPEQLLQITESKIINEYGRFSGNRKKTPKEWYHLFRNQIQPGLPVSTEKRPLPGTIFRIPGVFKQFRIFSARNLVSKITNRQYLLINLLEAPFLAALLAYLTRYRAGDDYIFGENRNLVAYLFMSVVVALFMGMMVSAEEIFRDRRLLKREAFLNLSRFSYLNSKILLLFTLSAIQTLLYVVVGNLVLGIHGMILPHWLMLFATACCANLVGLNLSSGLSSVVAIYITIPFILVPQLLLSGTVVPFDYLNPTIASKENVPLVGNLMTSRWTFEALAVEQFTGNRYEKRFYGYDCDLAHDAYQTAYVIPTLKSSLDECSRNLAKGVNREATANLLTVLRYEIPRLQADAGFRADPVTGNLAASALTDSVIEATKLYLDSLGRFFSSRMTATSQRRDRTWMKLEQEMGDSGVFAYRRSYYNENLADLVLNR